MIRGKTLYLSIIVLSLLLLSTISSEKISHAENENPPVIITRADNTDNVEIQNIQVQPSKIRVGDTFTVSATLVNNYSNSIILEHGACGSIFSVAFDNHVTVNEKNKNCTANLIIHIINPGEKITRTSPPSGHNSISYMASTTGTANATVTFPYSTRNQTDPNQSEIGKTISKSFLFTILDNSTGVKLANNTPLKQFKSGIAAEEIICKEGLNLVIKIHNHQPACVKPETKQKLIERGWGFDNNFLTLIEESDRIITGMVTDVEKYDNGRREVFLGVYEWLKNGTNAGAFLELDDIKNKETSKIDFKRGEKVLLFLKDIDENRGARDIFYTEKILPAKYPISLRDKVFSLVKPEDRGIQTRYQYDENCSKRDLFGDSYMYCTYEEKDARFYVPIDITAELVRNQLLEHVSEKYLQEHFDLKRAYDQAVINGHTTPSGQVMEFEYKLDDMTFLYLANISLSYSEVYLYYAPPREIQSLQYAEKMNDLIHSCFEPDTIVVFWDKVAVSHIENGFSPVITGAGPPAIYDRHGNTIQNHEKHFRFWPETGEIECSQGMQELPNKIKMQDKELLIDTTQFLKFK